MEHLYIDESGTMTTNYCGDFPYFVISVVRVFNNELLKRKIKRFISKHFEELKRIDEDGKMFKNNNFQELKGSALNKELKIKLAKYLMDAPGLFEVNIITINNSKIKSETYDNKARAFNYFLDLFLTYKIHKNDYPKDEYLLQIDERNVKTDARRSLEDYLSIELCLKQELIDKVSVHYFDSRNNSLIQLSDFFANLYYSFLIRRKNYETIINGLKSNKILYDDFVFPKY